jgi:hypothetical protein
MQPIRQETPILDHTARGGEMMTHDTQARYDAEGLLARMRSILDDHDAERRDIDDVNIYVGLMLYTLEELWDVVGRSDFTTGAPWVRYQARACAAVISDLCRQPDWDNAQDPVSWDAYNDTIKTIGWLLELAA